MWSIECKNRFHRCIRQYTHTFLFKSCNKNFMFWLWIWLWFWQKSGSQNSAVGSCCPIDHSSFTITSREGALCSEWGSADICLGTFLKGEMHNLNILNDPDRQTIFSVVWRVWKTLLKYHLVLLETSSSVDFKWWVLMCSVLWWWIFLIIAMTQSY